MHKRLFDSVILVWILALLPVLVLVGLWLHFAITCPPLPNGITTQGSYRYNSEQWLPLEEDVPDALDGDLYLSVRATTAVPENQRLYFFLDHIEAEISLNGETLFRSEDECSPQWAYFLSPGITQDDTLVIRLHNPHSYGNRRAYNAFLGSLHSQPYDHAGLPLPPMNLAMILLAVFVCVTAILVLGIAATTCLMQKPSGGKMLNLGLVTLLAGLYMVLDAPQKPLWLTGYTYFTPLKSVCLMLGVFELGLFARFNFGGIMRCRRNSGRRGDLRICNEFLLYVQRHGLMVRGPTDPVSNAYGVSFSGSLLPPGHSQAQRPVLCPAGAVFAAGHHQHLF